MNLQSDTPLSTRNFLSRVLVLAVLLSITYFGISQTATIDTSYAAGAPVLQTFRSDTSDGAYSTGQSIALEANYDASLFPGSSMTITLNTGTQVTLSHDGYEERGAYTDNHLNAIYANGNSIYAVSNSGLFVVVDVTSLASITETGSVATGGDVQDIDYAAANDMVYLANGSDGLELVDISTPASPTMRGSWTGGDDVYDADWTTLGIYTAVGTDGFAIISEADPDNLTAPASSLGTEAYSITFDTTGYYIYVGTESSVEVYYGGPGATRYAPTLQTDVAVGGQVTDVLLDSAENILYAAVDGVGLKVIDVSTPASATVLTTVASANGQRIARDGDLIYVTDTDGTMDVVDIRTPASASLAYSYAVSDAADVAIGNGNRPIVANQFGFVIVETYGSLSGEYTIEAGSSVDTLQVSSIDSEDVYSADGTAQAATNLSSVQDIGGSVFAITARSGSGGGVSYERNRELSESRSMDASTTRSGEQPDTRFNGGDGDGDGIDDALQPEKEQTIRAVTDESGELVDTFSSTIALETDRGDKCKVVKDFRNLSEEDVAVSEAYDFPIGLFDFTLECDEPGSTAYVTVILDRPYDTSLWRYVKYDAESGEYIDVTDELEVQFVTQSFKRGDVAGATVTKVRYKLTDGGPYDADGLENGVIVDPSGPALLAIVAQNLPSLSRPVVKSSTANKNTISLSFNDTLDVDEVPSAQAFSVKINGVLTSVESVKVIGGAVVLQLVRDIPSGAEVVVDYQSKIGSIVGQKTENSVNSFSDLEVVNITDSTDLVTKYRQCPVFTAIMRRGDRGAEVRQLQRFLNEQLDLPQPLTVDGVFGRGTEQAVIQFQEQYQDDILIDPWGEFSGTGYVYISTLAKINQLSGCGRTFASQPLILN